MVIERLKTVISICIFSTSFSIYLPLVDEGNLFNNLYLFLLMVVSFVVMTRPGLVNLLISALSVTMRFPYSGVWVYLTRGSQNLSTTFEICTMLLANNIFISFLSFLSSSSKFKASDHRTLALLSYFSRTKANFSHCEGRSSLAQTSLLSCVPYSVPWSCVGIHVMHTEVL